MRRLALVITLLAANLGTGYAQKAGRTVQPKGVVVAFFDQQRLQYGPGPATLEDFKFFFKLIQEIANRDFPDIQLKTLGRGELLLLPDGTRLNVETLRPELGFVLAARGKKRKVLTGVQSDMDFACAAAAFFGGHSSACPE